MGQVILVSRYIVFTDVNFAVQSVFSWAPWSPKVASKCESKHWYACSANGRLAVGVRSRDYQIS